VPAKREAARAKPDSGKPVLAIRKERSMADFHYLYILVSRTTPSRHHSGLTRNLKARLEAHNAGQIKHTTQLRRWRVDVAIAFSDPCHRRRLDKLVDAALAARFPLPSDAPAAAASS
jgi:predicted GIY-YIG superfamily endonuclease